MNPKDRSMICRMAGNIAGSVYEAFTKPDELFPSSSNVATRAVDIAISIIEETDRRIAEEKEK